MGLFRATAMPFQAQSLLSRCSLRSDHPLGRPQRTASGKPGLVGGNAAEYHCDPGRRPPQAMAALNAWFDTVPAAQRSRDLQRRSAQARYE